MKAKKMKSNAAMVMTAVKVAVIKKKMMMTVKQKKKKSRKKKNKKVMTRMKKLLIGTYVMSLICEHYHQQSHAWMTHALQ